MSREIISDELLSRFLEGRTNEEEEAIILKEMESDSALLDELLSMKKAAELADAEPLMKPDFALAEERIHHALCGDAGQKTQLAPRVFRFRPKLFWAAAASVVVAVTFAFMLMRHSDSSERYVAQNGGDTAGIEEKLSEMEMAQVRKEQLGNTESDVNQNNGESTSEASEAVTVNTARQEMEHVAEVEHVQRAAMQEANVLQMVKPAKNSYAVLCKNLDRSFVFEWTTDAVRELHFFVSDARGRRIASVTDETAEKYSLKYRDIYPERHLQWELSVVFQDGTKETKSGQIQIDYQL